MFKKFYARRKMVQAENPNAPDRAYVKDRYTHKVIYAGTKDACLNYVVAFGRCYVEAY